MFGKVLEYREINESETKSEYFKNLSKNIASLRFNVGIIDEDLINFANISNLANHLSSNELLNDEDKKSIV